VPDVFGRLDQLKRGGTVLTDYAYNPDGTVAQPGRRVAQRDVVHL
jgi:hypothetical protein